MILMHPQPILLVSTNVTDEEMASRMFTVTRLNKQTVWPELIEAEIEVSNVDRVALFNLSATSIELRLTDNKQAQVVQDVTVDLATGEGDYLQWIIHPIYIYPDATLRIRIHNPGADVRCGLVGVGRSSFVGLTQYGAKPGFADYSIVDTDEFGQTYLEPGAWAKKPDVRTMIEVGALDAVAEELTEARGSLVFFEANEAETQYEGLRAFGFIESWRIRTVRNVPDIAWVDISFQGVV